ncbi:MAG: periplasmic protein CpxP/Spy [Myxococcales bacterium]|nr:periplasmic protein CpxP/Spy [Myxococcales bacterium]
MKNVRTILFAVSLGTLTVGSVAAVGCGGSVEQPQTQTQASAVSKAPIAPQTHGVVKVFGDALGEVALRPDQRTELEKLAASAEQRHVAMADGKKDLMLAVADQIEKGTIDRSALQPKIDRIIADLEKGRPEDTASLARMHAILDPEQRNAFADALEAKFKNGHHGGKRGGEKSEHGAKGEAGDHAGGPKGMHGMMQLAEDLKLTDDQKSQIKDALKAGHEGHSFREMYDRMSEGKKVLESFRSDKFDANVATPAPEKLRERAAIGTSRALGVAEKILPILTADQRKIAAEKLRTMAGSGAELPFAH